jgi:hypothetical protein
MRVVHLMLCASLHRGLSLLYPFFYFFAGGFHWFLCSARVYVFVLDNTSDANLAIKTKSIMGYGYDFSFSSVVISLPQRNRGGRYMKENPMADSYSLRPK